MHTLIITEQKEGAEPVERLRQNLDHLDQSQLLAVLTILNKPPRRPRSDKGATRTEK